MIREISLIQNRKRYWIGIVAIVLAGATGWSIQTHLHREKTVDFSRDIRPILNQNCVGCHGGVRQKGNVSFIFRDEALGTGKSGKRTIVPGDPDGSELMRRVLSHDSEVHMPYHGPMLSQNQIDLLRQWIKEGAQFDNYWAFVAPEEQKLPEVKQRGWVRNPIDQFVLAKLEKENLKPSPEADTAELLRRASLDITGLPPTPQEEAAFEADHSPNAYEKQVDRLLASPRYGERWASMWLDLARYADSMGYEKDYARKGVWEYRDWVIDAYNANLPYDQFVIKQLAGDLLPNPTMSDRIATTFHRLTPNNQEGGTDDEEFRTIAVMDRVATTWNMLTGVTMNCVQCHAHPYDPIRHDDYYKSVAFFNTQKDADLDDDWPGILVPLDRTKYKETNKLENEAHSILKAVVDTDRALNSKTQWTLLPIQSAGADDVRAMEPLVRRYEGRLQKALKDTKLPPQKRQEAIMGAKKSYEDLKAEFERAKARGGLAQAYDLRNGEIFTHQDAPAKSYLHASAKPSLTRMTALRFSVSPINPDTARHTPEPGFIVNKVEAWVVSPQGVKTSIPFAYFAQDSEYNLNAAEREAEAPPPPPEMPAAGAKKSKSAPQPDGDDGGAKMAKTKFADHPPALPGEIPSLFAAMPKLFRTRWMVAVPAQPIDLPQGSHVEVDLKQIGVISFKPVQVPHLRLDITNDPAWTDAVSSHKAHTDHLFALDKQLAQIEGVRVPIMVEQEPYERRATLKFERGNMLTKVGPDLEPDVPAIFPKFPKGVARNRLTLAKWFFEPDQPLTARVAVNRYWEELFGTGIVETLENFGSVGEEPSNQALLDYLALHFQNDLHWDMKALLREIVTSATYRQSATVSPELLARDPNNRLLARGPQQRLTAEMVRDQALVASGLLNPAMHGAPVMPPQPAGIWNAYNEDKWKDEVGPNRYRRAVYTLVKRTAGYPESIIFDASDRETMLPRRIVTNTPLQALVTLNDPAFQEMAQAMAVRTLHDVPVSGSAEATLDARLKYEARLVLSRDPSPQELAVLRRAYTRALPLVEPGKILKVTFSTGPRPPDKREFAALTTVGSILFNLDAAMVR